MTKLVGFRKPEPTMINYKLIAKAIDAYERQGYVYIDTPWFVRPEIIEATLPIDRSGFTLGHPTLMPGSLVGSAEQGFLQMMVDNQIKPGYYCSAGPCFRDEPIVDELHLYNFFKLELIVIASLNVILPSARRIAHDAQQAIEDVCGVGCKLITTEDGFDFEINGIEVGSYGTRQYLNYHWVYGTGLALPRTILACSRRG